MRGKATQCYPAYIDWLQVTVYVGAKRTPNLGSVGTGFTAGLREMIDNRQYAHMSPCSQKRGSRCRGRSFRLDLMQCPVRY